MTPSTRVDGCHTYGSLAEWSRVLVRKGVSSNPTVDKSIFCFEIEISHFNKFTQKTGFLVAFRTSLQKEL